ncbi:hypothetical protein NDU88_006753 [Pleurodeles waltl]|uniref:Uncharacterized protein n=1 Tax=Pleurodeles waltl TaxID=8319 RepID=A0AAV7NUY5_PLEWA|nr:hypothetical protein NDU88_006753 [Pleurodeles waltl]
MYPKPASGASFGLGGETEGSQRERYATGSRLVGGDCLEHASQEMLLVSLQPPWGVRHERHSSSGRKVFWESGCIKSVEDLLYMKPVRHRPG